jgi:hypothetical protein
MHDDLGTADERGSKRVGARDPLYLHPLMIIQLPYAKGHGPAPKPMAMSPQQRVDPAISTDLPDAPLTEDFPAPGTGKPADPNSEFSSAEQGIKNAKQGINTAPRLFGCE